MSRRLLALFSHPDDETFGPAGAVYLAGRAPDSRVRVVSATRGEAGSLGISRQYSPHHLARIRQNELLEAGQRLGADIVLLGWPDKGIADVPHEVALETLVREVRLFRPHVVMTFHPNGISGHPDHIAMAGLAGDAFRVAAAADSFPLAGPAWASDRLLYFGLPESKARAVAAFRRIFAFPDDEISLTLDVREALPGKHAACRAHVSQLSFYEQMRSSLPDLDAFWSTEHFVLAGWHGPKPVTPLSGLFGPGGGT